MDLSSTKVHM